MDTAKLLWPRIDGPEALFIQTKSYNRQHGCERWTRGSTRLLVWGLTRGWPPRGRCRQRPTPILADWRQGKSASFRAPGSRLGAPHNWQIRATISLPNLWASRYCLRAIRKGSCGAFTTFACIEPGRRPRAVARASFFAVDIMAGRTVSTDT